LLSCSGHCARHSLVRRGDVATHNWSQHVSVWQYKIFYAVLAYHRSAVCSMAFTVDCKVRLSRITALLAALLRPANIQKAPRANLCTIVTPPALSYRWYADRPCTTAVGHAASVAKPHPCEQSSAPSHWQHFWQTMVALWRSFVIMLNTERDKRPFFIALHIRWIWFYRSQFSEVHNTL